MDNCRQRLLAGCVELGLALSKDKIDALLSFIELIAKWNKAYNLTAIPLAALGMVTPLIAAATMAGSSLLVTLNALRLMRGARS